MDLAYYRYLAQTIPPREIARALAVRARQKLLRGKPFFFDVPELQRRRERLYAHVERRPTVFERLAAAGIPGEAILREAEAARRGELLLFGQWKKCGTPIDYHRDPLVPHVRYDASVPGETIDLFQSGADAKVMWELGRLPQLWRFALPGIGNLWLVLLKDSALISVVGLAELIHKTAITAGATRQPFTFYFASAMIYLAFTIVSSAALHWAERRAGRGFRSA